MDEKQLSDLLAGELAARVGANATPADIKAALIAAAGDLFPYPNDFKVSPGSTPNSLVVEPQTAYAASILHAFRRQLIFLKPGEVAPDTLDDAAPPGFRFETDDEFRGRILAAARRAT